MSVVVAAIGGSGRSDSDELWGPQRYAVMAATVIVMMMAGGGALVVVVTHDEFLQIFYF